MCAIVVANFKAYQELVFFCYLSLDPVPFSPVFVCLALGGELYSFGINVFTQLKKCPTCPDTSAVRR